MSCSPYLTSLRENLKATYVKLSTALDPAGKEQRTYPVLPSPELVRDIASILIQLSENPFPEFNMREVISIHVGQGGI